MLPIDSLKHNFFSISQLCDKGFKIIFEALYCVIKDVQDDKTIFMSYRNDNVYTIGIQKYDSHDKCFSSIHDQSWSWHRRLEHVNINLISQLNKNNL